LKTSRGNSWASTEKIVSLEKKPLNPKTLGPKYIRHLTIPHGKAGQSWYSGSLKTKKNHPLGGEGGPATRPATNTVAHEGFRGQRKGKSLYVKGGRDLRSPTDKDR